MDKLHDDVVGEVGHQVDQEHRQQERGEVSRLEDHPGDGGREVEGQYEDEEDEAVHVEGPR